MGLLCGSIRVVLDQLFQAQKTMVKYFIVEWADEWIHQRWLQGEQRIIEHIKGLIGEDWNFMQNLYRILEILEEIGFSLVRLHSYFVRVFLFSLVLFVIRVGDMGQG